MATLTGTAGSVTHGTAPGLIGEMKTWSLNVAVAELDTSSFGNSWKEFTGGIGEWSGSFEGNADPSDAGQDAMWTNLVAGSLVELRFYMSGTVFYQGTAMITSQDVGQSFDGLATQAFNFRGSGTLAPPT